MTIHDNLTRCLEGKHVQRLADPHLPNPFLSVKLQHSLLDSNEPVRKGGSFTGGTGRCVTKKSWGTPIKAHALTPDLDFPERERSEK